MYRVAEVPNSNNAWSDDEGYDILKYSELHPVLHYSYHEQAPTERIQKPSMVDTSSDHPLRSASPTLISLENEDEATSEYRQLQLSETMKSPFPSSVSVSGSVVFNSQPGSRSDSENEGQDSEGMELQEPDQVLDELSDTLQSHHSLDKLDESHNDSPVHAVTHTRPGFHHSSDIDLDREKGYQVLDRKDKKRSHQVPFLGIPDHADLAESFRGRLWPLPLDSPLQSESDTDAADLPPKQNLVGFEEQLDELEETPSVVSEPYSVHRGCGTVLLESRADSLKEWAEPSKKAQKKKKPRKRRRKNGPEKAVPKPKTSQLQESARSKENLPVRPTEDTPREKLAVDIYCMLAAGTNDAVHDFASLVKTISQGFAQGLREMDDEEVHDAVAGLFYATHPELYKPWSAEVANSESDVAHDEDPYLKETHWERLGIAVVAQAILMLFLFIIMRVVPYLWVLLVNNIHCVWPDLHFPGLH